TANRLAPWETAICLRDPLNFPHALASGLKLKKGIITMARWKPIRRLFASIAVVALFISIGTWCCASRQNQRIGRSELVAPQAIMPQEKIDLNAKPLDRIPVGTVIGRQPPKDWSHLVLFAVPTLTREDERDAPRMATRYAKMFKFTVLANIARRGN